MLPGEQVPAVAKTARGPAKRRKKDDALYTGGLLSLDRDISPPPLRRASSSAKIRSASTWAVPSRDGFVMLHPNYKSIGGGSKKRPANHQDFIDLTGEDSEQSDATIVDSKPKLKQRELSLTSPRAGLAKALPSPFQLTSIRDLPTSENVDTVGIKDILGDVMIKEAWIFNYLVDLDWVM